MEDMSTPIDPLPKPPRIRRQSTSLPPVTEDSGDTCRICRGEATSDQPLFYPCKCSGSIKYVHQNCLMEWLSHSQKKYCELCKTPFRFTKLYDQSMPENVPWMLFGKQVIIHTFRGIGRWARYSIVTFIWLCWLPWTIRQIWRALFWIADGSWLDTQELEAAVQEYGSHLSNTSALSLSDAIANTTFTQNGVTSVGFFSTVVAIFSLLDPHTILRFLFRSVLQIVIWPTMKGEPIKWEGAFLFAPMPRPPSLFSDFQALASATRFPIVNNAILDVLEGQLVCLTIVTAFILVFLIREWVINQQPLLNQPDEEQPENVPAGRPADGERRAARRQRRPAPRAAARRPPLQELIDATMQLENHDRPRREHRPRRRATENNILVPATGDIERPPAPVRAQSLVPALQELEDNARLIGEIGDTVAHNHSLPDLSTVEPPPLQRGTFDEVGQIRRAIEEASPVEYVSNQSASSPSVPDVTVGSEYENNHPSPEWSDVANIPNLIAPSSLHLSSSQNDFTFRSENQFSSRVTGEDVELHATAAPIEDVKSDSDVDAEALLTPESSQTPGEMADDKDEAQSGSEDEAESDSSEQDEQDVTGSPDIEPNGQPNVDEISFLERLGRWLWQTDDMVTPETVQTEILADIGTQGSNTAVAPEAEALENAAVVAPVQIPQAQADPLPPVPQAVAADQNAIDDAEDLEGVLELLGMEGPIAGMVQNIIFSVFLITLTLSASVWCPYIWGKITLLFVAHPVSVFIKAPLFVLSKTADFIIDLGLLMIGLTGMLVNSVAKMVKLATFPFIPRFSGLLNTELMERLTSSLSHNSSARLEKSIAKTLLGFRPDLPTFSIQSHHVLRVFSRTARNLVLGTGSNLYEISSDIHNSFTWERSLSMLPKIIPASKALPTTLAQISSGARQWLADLQHDLRPIPFAKLDEIDYSLIHWSASEKIFCIVLGYTLFTTVGCAYMKICRRVLGLKPSEKVPGMLADTLRQAGGVIKVIVIIGIEMIVFPLYCGTMLDFALLPLFKGATLSSRLQFFAQAPLTALFIHWFLGTCYMFHFALFVSMCRKLMRKGVLYFIRDPDDPAFHPVRDVLERPVATQLGKIAFSAFVYGSLLVICLGGVVSGLNKIGNILPIQWGVKDNLMVIPGDVIFYNFMLPFILRKVDVSKRLSELFGWWFRACAAGLRLSDFFFGIDNEDEKKAGIFLWRRFFKVALYGHEESKHPMVKYVENLANHLHRLLWIEATNGTVDREFITRILGWSPIFKVMNLVDDKSEALIEFGKDEDMSLIKVVLDGETVKPDSRCRVKHVRDIKIEVVEKRLTRNTPIDKTAGSYVRAPAKDSVRIPKGTPVFLRVNEKDVRLDGKEDSDSGLHGRMDDRFSRIYIPTHFRARVSAFIGLIWFFVAITGLAFTVGPLLLGRAVMRLFDSSNSINDLYALTIGVHIFGSLIFTAYFVKSWYNQNADKLANIFKNSRNALPLFFSLATRIAGFAYLAVSLGFVTPMALSMLAELYINVPAYTYLTTGDVATEQMSGNPLLSTTQGAGTQPVIHLLQTWAMGLLYLRILLRFASAPAYENTRPAIAVKAIIRGGLLRPDIKLASRALILPTLFVCTVLLGLPLAIARVTAGMYADKLTDEEVTKLYRYTYPIVLAVAFNLYTIRRLFARIERWRVKIRDEVYLIGERLHNFPGQEDTKGRKKMKSKSVKGKERAGAVSMNPGSGIEKKVMTYVETADMPEIEHEVLQDALFEDDDQEKRIDLDRELDEFRDSTGLEELPTAAEIGEFGRSVFEAT